MTEIFLQAVNLSISAGWLVLAVLLLRLALKKAPRWTALLLWGIVGLRLLIPLSIESAVSLLPSAETISPEIVYAREPTIHIGVAALNSVVNPMITASFAPDPAASANPLQIWIPAASVIWLLGAGVMLVCGLISYLRLRSRIRTAVLLQDNIYRSEFIPTPFVLGLVRPKIYLPYAMDEAEIPFVLAHEQTHIRRRDHWIKPLGFVLLALHWFNPLLWAAYILLCRDLEVACDERVAKAMDPAQRAEYSQTLLSCSVPRRQITACPVAFGEVGVKERVRHVLHYRKPAFWLVAAALVLSAAVGVCFLTVPQTGRPLTLETVARLSSKGEDLSWEDFSRYSYTETGSGLYIRRYEIDEMFTLLVGGKHPQGQLMYVYLTANDNTDTRIDIRYEDVQSYVEAHKDNPVIRNCSHNWFTCAVGSDPGIEEILFRWGTLPKKAAFDSVCSLPVVTITDEAELAQFIAALGNSIDPNRAYEDTDSFSQIMEQYNKEFFKHARLHLLYTTQSSTANRLHIDYVQKSEGVLHIGVAVSAPGSGDAVEEGWFVAVSIPKDQLENVNEVDSRISAVYDPEQTFPNGDLIGLYGSRGKGFAEISSISLYDSGEFVFSFSPLSSYIGHGSYTLEDDRLVLQTEDGVFTYEFDVVNGNLVFDADASSSMVWYSGMTDGSVFLAEPVP